jgi:hypothetical protein
MATFSKSARFDSTDATQRAQRAQRGKLSQRTIRIPATTRSKYRRSSSITRRLFPRFSQSTPRFAQSTPRSSKAKSVIGRTGIPKRIHGPTKQTQKTSGCVSAANILRDSTPAADTAGINNNDGHSFESDADRAFIRATPETKTTRAFLAGDQGKQLSILQRLNECLEQRIQSLEKINSALLGENQIYKELLEFAKA